MVCINIRRPFIPTGKEKDGDDVDEGSMFYTPGEYFLKSRDDLKKYYEEFPNSELYFENTNKIADSIEWIKLDKEKKFPCEYDDPDAELMRRVVEGLNNKIQSGILSATHKETYIGRLKEELDTIVKMGFSDYFIEIQNIILWANKQGITTGPGRGCFHENSILTDCNGKSIEIKNAYPGMKVFSSDLSVQEVISVFRYEIEEQLNCISYKHKNILRRVFSTCDHKFLVALKSDINSCISNPSHYFLEAEEIDRIEHVLVGRDDNGYIYISISDVYKVSSSKYTVYDLSVTGNNTFMVGDSFVHNSGAGSFINFILDITRVNPLDYGLLFTRKNLRV